PTQWEHLLKRTCREAKRRGGTPRGEPTRRRRTEVEAGAMPASTLRGLREPPKTRKRPGRCKTCNTRCILPYRALKESCRGSFARAKLWLIFQEQGRILSPKETAGLDEVLRVWRLTTMQEGFRKFRDEDTGSFGRGEIPRVFAA